MERKFGPRAGPRGVWAGHVGSGRARAVGSNPGLDDCGVAGAVGSARFDRVAVALRQAPTPPGRRGSTRSKPSRCRIEAARPLRLPPLQIVAIGRSRGSSSSALGEVAVGDVERAGDVARSRTRRRCGRRGPRAPSSPSSRSASSSGSISSIRCTGRSSERQAVIPPSRKPRTRRPTEASSSAASQLVAVGGGDDDELGVRGDDPRDLGREAGVVGGGADRAGDVGLVELLVGAARRRRSRRRRSPPRPPRGRQRRRRAELLDQRAAVERDDVLDVGRPVAERGDRVARRTPPRRRCARARLWRALEADRRGGLEVDRRSCRRASRRGARARPRPRRAAPAGARAASGRCRPRPRAARPRGRGGRRRR